MMISIVIGLLIIAALVGVLISNAGNSKTNDRTAELQSNGRYALDQLEHELRQAGYRGFNPIAPESISWTTPVITNECDTPGSFVKNIRQAVWGADDSNPFSGNCLSVANAKYNTAISSDVLVIRRGDENSVLKTAITDNLIYIHSTYNNIVLGQVGTLPADTPDSQNSALHVSVYYIGTDDQGPDPTVPALRKMDLNGTTMQDVMVVSGIEELQVEFGVTNTDGTTQYFTPNLISGSPSSTGATNWDKVSSVRIWLLARNAKPEIGYNNTSTYTMSDKIYGPMADSFRRQVFSTVVQLRNFRN